MRATCEIRQGAPSDIPQLRAIFLSLHDHHRTVSAVALTEPDERAWQERAATYEHHFAQERALLHLAHTDAGCVGYAFTILQPGSDDTFPLGAGYAELYTLAVLPQWRGAGVGTALLDAVDAALTGAGIPSLTVAVMAHNDAAIRFYRRRGLVPGELIMYRVGAGGEGPAQGGQPAV